MDHIAIMNPKRKLLPRILSGQKTIESRWYQTRRDPRTTAQIGETVYFKDAGKPVTVRARIADVKRFELQGIQDVLAVVDRYGDRISGNNASLAERGKEARYCILIFLEQVEEVAPFQIDRTGFGSGSAWISVADIARIKV